jgi:hypothetical protein
MRQVVKFVTVLGFLLFALSMPARQPAPAQTTTAAPQRDPQALAILQTGLIALGGAVPSDTVATGTIQIVAGSKTDQGTIRILTRGLDQSLEEIDTPEGVHKIVFSRGMASETLGAATRKLSMQASASSQSAGFPLPLLISSISPPDISIQFIGLETLDGAPAQHVRVWDSLTSRPTLQAIAKFTVKDLWFDPSSGVLRKISFLYGEADGLRVPSALISVDFFDYRKVGNALYPFLTKKSLNGVPWVTIVIQSVATNTGLSDLDFPVPTGRTR